MEVLLEIDVNSTCCWWEGRLILSISGANQLNTYRVRKVL